MSGPQDPSVRTDAPRARIAYFSMEVGLESRLPTYSGGLGVLAGDTLRAAADLALPVVAVSLVHRYGYFEQSLDDRGVQADAPDAWSPEDELTEVPERVELELGGRAVVVRAFEYRVRGVGGAEVPVLLLDTDLAENADADRKLTHHLYGGDRRYRLLQEAVLGIGGFRMLRALGYRGLHTLHLNEGHSALAQLALLEEVVAERDGRRVTERDENRVRQLCAFTTHTPVPAGHDRFDERVVEEVLGERRTRMLRGRGLADGVLNMTHLAMHFARFVNGVALRHAQVSREMFPGREIFAITNGVHVPTWTCPPMADLFDRHIGSWRADPYNLRQAALLPLDELARARGQAKARLLQVVRERSGVEMDPGVLTLGFARRATPYKRADLLFHDPRRLKEVAASHGGLQVVYSGKAHPKDEGGQAMIRRVHEAGRELGPEVKVVWLEDYDMELGGLITSGVDVWLNNPEKPKEASGTSGMKAALNGVPNLSVLDGWWIEGHVEGVTGWSVGESWRDPSERAVEAGIIYDKLDRVILPLYRDDPEAYDRIRRNAITLNGPHFSARRMMDQYRASAYAAPEPSRP